MGEMQTSVKPGLNRIIHERKKKPVSILSECVNVCVQGVVPRKTRFQLSEKTQCFFVCLPPGLHTHTHTQWVYLCVSHDSTFSEEGLMYFRKNLNGVWWAHLLLLQPPNTHT